MTTDSLNARDYLNLFPSVHLSYDLPKNNAIQISYSRRVRRPRFWDLNPFFTFSDARNFFSGNPNLDPEFTDSYEIGHIKYWDNASLSSAIYYRYTTDVIQRIRVRGEEVDGQPTTLGFPINLGTRDNFGFEFTFSYKLKKWWRLNGDLNFFRAITEGQYVTDVPEENTVIDLNADTYSWTSRLTSRMTFWKDIDFQIRGNYRAPRETPQGRAESITHFDVAVSRDVFKKKGTLTLSVRDIFNGRRRRYETFGDDFFSEGDFQWRERQIDLTLNYRLNQKKQRSRRGSRGGGNFDGGGGEF